MLAYLICSQPRRKPLARDPVAHGTSIGRYASCDERRSHTRDHSEERDQKSGVLWHQNEKIQPPQFGRASDQTRDLGLWRMWIVLYGCHGRWEKPRKHKRQGRGL